MRGLPEGWRIIDMAPDKIDKHLKEVARISKEMAEIPRIIREAPKPPPGATPEELEAFYFAQQPESTQSAILRQKERKAEDDNDYLLRPISPDYLANPNASTLDDLTAKRSIDPEDALREKRLKTGRNQPGQNTKGSVEGEKRDRGIEAFTYSPPANPSDEDIRRLKKLEPIEAVLATKEESKPDLRISWLDRIRWALFAYEGESLKGFVGRKE